jgi:phosphoadenosine phosphosulfate reductase
MDNVNISEANASVAPRGPAAIIEHALAHAQQQSGPAMVSTNFRPGEAVILHLVTQQLPDIPVLWVDHGYNTPDTYRFAQQLIDRLKLNVHLYIPAVTVAYRDAVLGGIPSLDDKQAHDAFTEERKLEPFKRGMEALKPSVWFTALRHDQTAFRAGLEAFDQTADGVLKVCPILSWDTAQLEAYLQQHNLPDESVYFDPTKVDGNRECGLHPGLAK